MAEFPALPLWTDAYLGDTNHLTTLEHGAYLLLLISMWRAGGKLPNDDKRLARFARLTTGQWARIRPTLIPFFRVDPDGQLSQGRLTDELDAVRQHSKRQSDRSKRRWLKNKDNANAAGMPDACTLTLTTTPSQEVSKKETPAVPKNGNGHLPEGILPLAELPRTLEAEFFGRGKQVLGKNAGGLLSRLLKARGGNVALARASLELASTKEDPREFIGAAIRSADAENSPREIAGGRL